MSTCSQCHASMNCGAQAAACWCQQLPSLPKEKYAQQAACLCAHCLRKKLLENVVLYGIANCNTVKKARAWLAEKQVSYVFWDYKKHGVPADELKNWLEYFGWQQVLNLRGTTWKKCDAATQAAVVDAQTAHAFLLQHASAIKRPIVQWGQSEQRALDLSKKMAPNRLVETANNDTMPKKHARVENRHRTQKNELSQLVEKVVQEQSHLTMGFDATVWGEKIHIAGAIK